MANNYGSNRDNKVMADSTVIQPSADEGPSPFVQQGMSQKKFVSAQVQFLDYREHTFHVHRKANGLILIDMVAAFLDLKEKDYFGLAYLDEQKTEHWLYPDKRISKQLKGVPLEFSFQVKFYPPQPTQLSEDLTRYLLYLQLRRDVYTERLPVSFAAQAHLGSLVAQAVLGDYQPTGDYADHLSNARIAQPTSEQEQFINYLRELHKQHRGMTAQEAELAYLNECKGLAMYGVHLFHGKDNKNKPTQVGVSSHGISVYSEQMRVHRFAWPGIIKFSFRRHNFSVKVKPGEIDSKKEASVSYHMGDYKHAKLLWKCAVEHHGFFRLIQPEPRHKHSLLSFGSTRFRYTGRTNIQSQMVSQLFDTNAPMAERAKSKSADMIAQKGHKEHSSPLNYADETTPEKPDKKGRPIDVHFVETKVMQIINESGLISKNNNFAPHQRQSTTANSKSPHPDAKLLFRQMELPHAHIENSVTLYNCGVSENIILKNFANKIGITGAFHEKYILRSRIHTKRQLQLKPISRFTHLAPHRHSGILHPLQPKKELYSFPLKYFVGVTHSGHSVNPHKDISARYEGYEDISDVAKDDYQFPKYISFDPLRIERSEELEGHPLRPFCGGMKKGKETRFGPVIQLKHAAIARVTPTVNDDYPFTVYDGCCEVIRLSADLKLEKIEQFVQQQQDAVEIDEANKGKTIITQPAKEENSDDERPTKLPIQEMVTPKEKEIIFLKTTVPSSARTASLDIEGESTELGRHKSISNEELQRLSPASQLAYHLFEIKKERKPEGNVEKEQRASKVEKKFTAKIVVTSSDSNQIMKRDVVDSTAGGKENVSNEESRTKLFGYEESEHRPPELPIKMQIKSSSRQKGSSPEEGPSTSRLAADETKFKVKRYGLNNAVASTRKIVGTGFSKIFKQTDGKKKKKEKFTKKKADKKQKKRTTANGQKSTSASSSSSSSSSSDAEAEEIHVIVHDNKQKTAEQLLENSPEQLLKKAPELNATPVQTADTSTLPRTTVQTWHEESHGPEQVTTEVDEEGNVIRRIVKTDHIKHTVHTQSYQTVPVTADVTNSAAGISLQQVHTVQTNGIPNGDDATPGELVSTKVVTTGNRTIETLTYKTEKDGVVETRVEHRITIHANDEIDHEAELSRAILEATSMNPDMKVEKVEIERGKN